MSEPAVEIGECTLADMEEYAGVVVDRTGDYAAGRTIFHATPEAFLEFVALQTHESE